MALTYFKRFRMEIAVNGKEAALPAAPARYRLLAWRPELLAAHAEAKYASFHEELDANVFPCLGNLPGCRRLMEEISLKPGFLPTATWLLVCDASAPPSACGTIQGICDRHGLGAVQNLGVAPEHRGHGLGHLLMHYALAGFREAGMERVYLEVTSQNVAAIRLYEQMGFRKVRTVYKAAEVA